MKQFRWLYVAFLLIYAVLVIGIQFHTHSAPRDQLAADCKSCQISQCIYDRVTIKDLRISQPVLYHYETEPAAIVIRELQEVDSGRSPPRS